MAPTIRYRNAEGTPAADGTPAPTPTPAPAPIQVRNNPAPSNPPAAPRPVAEVTAERSRLLGEAEALQTRSRTEQLGAADETQLDGLLDRIEQLNEELPRARRAERLAAQRALQTQPTRPAPQFTPTQRSAAASEEANAEWEALRIWMRSHTDDADRSPDANYRASQAGFTLGAPSARFGGAGVTTMNREKRRTLSTGGVGTGKELVPNTYSGKVTEYITYFSPLLGMVDSEVTDDGAKRTYFRVDDTSLISSYVTASAGTEVSPTIPDSDVATGAIDILVFDATSGYHKLTRNVLRDSAVVLGDKVTKAIGNSHARLMERDTINGTGNGTTAIQGILTAGTRYGAAVDTFTPDLFEALYFAMPLQYRSGAIWLFSDSSMAKAVNKLKDTTGKSLFGKTNADGAEIRTLFERPCITSAYMPAYGANAKCVSFFHPGFYMLRMVAGQSIDVLREKFYPHLAYTGGISFGGAYLGPASANQYLQLDATPDNGSGT